MYFYLFPPSKYPSPIQTDKDQIVAINNAVNLYPPCSTVIGILVLKTNATNPTPRKWT